MGQTVFGRYRLTALIARGGMGVVWRAHDEELGIDIALKFLAEDFLHDPGALSDLKKETRRGMELAHPNIVRIYGFFHDERYAAIGMEYIDGNTISALRTGRASGIFEVEELKDWVQQMCAALQYAHYEAELIHRDLKPANLMVDARGRLKVADFGIAASLNDAHTRVTRSDGTRGTLLYMSPQQLLGQRPCISHDIYGIGATLYELLTSQPPFYNGDISLQVREVIPPALAARRAEFDITDCDPVPEAWEETIAACLAKDASLRPADASEVARRLGLDASGMVTAKAFPDAKTRSTTPLPMLHAAPTAVEPLPPGTQQPADTGPITAQPPPQALPLAGGKKLRTLTVVGALILVAAILLAFGYNQIEKTILAKAEEKSTTPTESPQQTERTVPPPIDSETTYPSTPPVPERGQPGAPRGQYGPPGSQQGPPGVGPRGSSGSFPRPGTRGHPGDVAAQPLVQAAETAVATAGHPFKLKGTDLTMLWLPPGNVEMGVPDFERQASDNEKPVTRLVITTGFWLSSTEVTQADYEAVMGTNPSNQKGEKRPVENVSWQDAMTFCQKINERERQAGRLPQGYHYDLPTQGQWVYVAKKGGRGPHGSNGDIPALAVGSDSGARGSQPVASKLADVWGFYDLFGNVSEWTSDYYSERLPGGRVTDWQGPASGTKRTVRGSSWVDDRYGMRATVRHAGSPTQRSPRVGFRLALVPQDK